MTPGKVIRCTWRTDLTQALQPKPKQLNLSLTQVQQEVLAITHTPLWPAGSPGQCDFSLPLGLESLE